MKSLPVLLGKLRARQNIVVSERVVHKPRSGFTYIPLWGVFLKTPFFSGKINE
jgi:hypothetical protein